MSLCLIKHHTTQGDLWISAGIDPHILNLNTRWRWVVKFTIGLLEPSGTQWKGDWGGGTEVCLHTKEKRKIFGICLELNPNLQVLQPLVWCYFNWEILEHCVYNNSFTLFHLTSSKNLTVWYFSNSEAWICGPKMLWNNSHFQFIFLPLKGNNFWLM